MSEMTKDNKEIIPDYQGAASALLVTMGMKYTTEVINKLLELFGPGVVPHFFIIKTLSDLAVANPVAVVPLLSDVLSRMLPVLAAIKQDEIRRVFGACIGFFCEAILNYKANVEVLAVDVSIFAPQVFAAYELMSANWLQSKDLRVRLVTIQAIGSCVTIMSTAQFETQLEKLIPLYNNMYKKEKPEDHLAITQGYCSLLSVATREETLPVIEPMIDGILNTFFPLICKQLDYGDGNMLKNHSEMLRSVEIIAKQFIDTVLTFLFMRLQKGDAKVRHGVLLIIKHLITRNQIQLEDSNRKGLVLSSLRPLVEGEQDLLVKKSLAQVIISMANENYLCLEGGETLVEFIILNSSITDEQIKKWEEAQGKKGDPGLVSPAELRGMCDHILSLMTNTIPSMVDVLWPYLLEPLTKPRFNTSMAVVSKCISQISKVKRASNAPNYLINFDQAVNLPKPQAILARLFVLANLTNRRGSLAAHLLATLQHIGPIIHPNVVSLWDNTIPRLLSFLSSEGFTSEGNDSKWEGLVRRLLTETLKAINDDNWTMEIGNSIIAQFPLHEGDPEAKKLALKLLGVIVQSVTHKDWIRKTLKTMFDSTNHSDEEEKLGCAQGFGYAAAAHLDTVLEQQNSQVRAPEPKKESGGFFGSLFGGGGDSKPKAGPAGNSLSTTLLAYGYITAYAKPDIITSRLDMHVITNVLPHLDTKTVALQQTLVKVFDLIGQSVHNDHLKLANNYTFKHRDEFLRRLLSYINLNPPPAAPKKDPKAPAEPVKRSLLIQPFPASLEKLKLSVLGLNACSTLIRLDPVLPRDLEEELVVVVSQFLSVEKETPKEDKKPVKGSDELEKLDLALIFENLDRALMSLLQQDKSIACLKRLLQVVTKFFASHELEHRKRASSSYVRLLKKYIELVGETMQGNVKTINDRQFEGLGNYIGVLLPRCCDPSSVIRGNAIESIQLLLYIHWMLEKVVKELSEGKASSDIDLRAPKTLAPFTGLRKKMVSLEDQNEQFGLAHSMASILAKLIQTAELPHLISSAIQGLVDSQVTGARGTCVILFGLVSERGADLEGHVTALVTKLIKKMKRVKNEQTMNGSLHALRTIAKIHLAPTIDSLLLLPIPHEPHVAKVIGLFATDAELVVPSVKALTELLNNGDILEEVAPSATEKKGTDKKKVEDTKPKMVPTKESKGATVCLAEMLSHPEMEEVVLQRHFALFFGTLALRVGMTCEFEEAADQCVTAWKNFFTVIQEEDVLEKLVENGTLDELKKEATHISGITSVASVVARRHLAEMDKIFAFLVPYLKANFNGQRVVTAFVFAEFINHVGDNDALLEKLVNNLLNSLVDPLLKIPALRGLGNIAQISSKAMVDKYSPTVLDALMSAIDDKLDDVVLEAMNGLSKIFKVVDEARIAPILINIFHRIRPAFDNPNFKIRSSAAILFSSLARFGKGASREKIVDQIHSNLPSIVLHINDPEDEVKKSFRQALYSVGPLLGNEQLTTILTTSHIFNVDYDTDYDDFVRMHLVKVLIAGFPQHINNYLQTCINPYFESTWDEIKGNAAHFVGCTMGQLNADIRKEVGINPAHTSKALIGLLSSESPLVRRRAAEAMSMLHSY
eukprot:TRINITY_DN5940_c0_g1_i1.p1 TRINITY_DN5940_c0_g1~~TRINITY_DN5940_c0_g1_i1.p1  ORF type:complete len:1700 (-),score=516.03 TRINITY_DN5940_c0_g1_i1:86-4894(-)